MFFEYTWVSELNYALKNEKILREVVKDVKASIDEARFSGAGRALINRGYWCGGKILELL